LKVLAKVSWRCLLSDLLGLFMGVFKGWAGGSLSRLYCDRH
jgi:hypothetical protein